MIFMKYQPDLAERVNRNVYRDSKVVNFYNITSLQNAEVKIFIKYSEYLKGSRFLDIGCGVGRTTFFISPFCSIYTGIDYSPEMVSICKNRFPQITFVVCDVRNIVFANCSFDLALFSFNGIDYIGHEDRKKAFAEIHRVLRRNGLLVFSTHNRNYGFLKRRPTLSLSLNPYRQMRLLDRYWKGWINHRKNRKFEQTHGEYKIINTESHNWALVMYYITKEMQRVQLMNAGFEVLDMYDHYGNELKNGSEDSQARWIYYVARAK